MLEGSELVAFVGCRDLGGSNEFYGGVLGLELIESTPVANLYVVGATMLRVTQVEHVVCAPYTVLGWSVRDIAAAVEWLGASGVRFRRYDEMRQDEAGIWTAPGGARVAWFADPDGNTLALSQRASPEDVG